MRIIRARRARGVRRSAAAAAILLGAIAAEGGLRLAGADPPWSPLLESLVRADPFERYGPPDAPRYRTRPAYRRFLLDQDAPWFPPPRRPRLGVLGGSAAYGWGLNDPARDGFVPRLARRLGGDWASAAGLGWGSTRAAAALPALLALRPSVVIVMTGHNEAWERPLAEDLAAPRPNLVRIAALAERSRLLRAGGWLLVELNGRTLRLPLDTSGRWTPPSAGEAARIAARFRANLAAIAAGCRAAGVPLVLVTPPVNLAGDSFAGAAPPAAAAASRPLLEEAARLDAAGRTREALEVRWRLLESSGLTVTRPLLAAIRDTACRAGAELADAEAAFRAAGPSGPPGGRGFLDAIHLDASGHARLAGVVEPAVRRALRGRWPRSSGGSGARSR